MFALPEVQKHGAQSGGLTYSSSDFAARVSGRIKYVARDAVFASVLNLVYRARLLERYFRSHALYVTFFQHAAYIANH